MSSENVYPSDCECGNRAVSTRVFTGASWQCRVQCMSCGIVAGKGDDLVYATKLWNRLQAGLAAKPAAPDLSVIVSFRNDITDYVVRVGTMAQLDKPMSFEIGATCYRADRVSLKDTFIQAGARRYRNAPTFIAWMAQGGVTLERMQ